MLDQDEDDLDWAIRERAWLTDVEVQFVLHLERLFPEDERPSWAAAAIARARARVKDRRRAIEAGGPRRLDSTGSNRRSDVSRPPRI